MSAGWMLVILLGCGLPRGSRSRSDCDCVDEVTPVCARAGEAVPVPCPALTAEEVTFTLLRDGQAVFSHRCNHTKGKPSCSLSTDGGGGGGAGVSLRDINQSLSFVLAGQPGSRGVYQCEGKVTFPPPYKTLKSAVKTLVIVEEQHCKCPPRPASQTHQLNWVWMLVVGLLCVYGVAITIVAVVNWVKLRRSDSDNDYMNTHPRPTKKRGRKKGFQNPIPRHF